jgi:methylmalonyl-CoA/ethylmalonyl-CoA epimerase
MDIFDKLHHVCIVVRDIDKTRAYYESIGIGPWQEYGIADAQPERLRKNALSGLQRLQHAASVV